MGQQYQLEPGSRLLVIYWFVLDVNSIHFPGAETTFFLKVPAIGGRPNTSFITINPSPLTDRGFVKVTPSLQVESHPSIFAAGDIIDWPEVKQFSKTKRHVPVVTASVLAYLKGAQSSAQYGGARDVMIVTNGRVSSRRSPYSLSNFVHSTRMVVLRTSKFYGGYPSEIALRTLSSPRISWLSAAGKLLACNYTIFQENLFRVRIYNSE